MISFAKNNGNKSSSTKAYSMILNDCEKREFLLFKLNKVMYKSLFLAAATTLNDAVMSP